MPETCGYDKLPYRNSNFYCKVNIGTINDKNHRISSKRKIHF